MTYEQARADHEYLWSINAADDMTGAYVDQDDLAKLLKSPTKKTARECFERQIEYWFDVGPDLCGARLHLLDEGRVRDIADRHGFEIRAPVEALLAEQLREAG